ncbi:MAG: hypothetical protein Q9190_007129, partial [Brigantiaea leucoxantha]
MLDECKGEKLEEVLIAFSSIVLQRTMSKQGIAGSISSQLSVAQTLSTSDQKSLLPLAIAHKASLSALLRQKNLLRQRFLDFHVLLDEKEAELLEEAERLAQVDEARSVQSVPNAPILEIKQQLDLHSHDNPRLVDAISDGGEQGLFDPLLQTPFRKVWPRVQEGTVDTVGLSRPQSLLQDLESRIQDQQDRLQRWRRIKAELVQTETEGEIDKPRETKRRDLGLALDRHRQPEYNIVLSEDASAPDILDGSLFLNSADVYGKLRDSLRSELARVGQTGQSTHAEETGEYGDPEQPTVPPEVHESRSMQAQRPSQTTLRGDGSSPSPPSMAAMNRKSADDRRMQKLSQPAEANPSRKRFITKSEAISTSEHRDSDPDPIDEISRQTKNDILT